MIRVLFSEFVMPQEAARELIVRWRSVHARAGRSAAVLFRN